ncbi:hypothetical protein [Pseudomonas sp. MWU13-2105]|uniref:YobI family P-loop NTPase n=1 Tax=Pseudomonas sp. MWU13-2105 TaxID=2935074 RepID=UPI00200D5EF5|nr:hypothetical protein [Pseudomonas sp. MWU13-2105]
MRNRLIISTKEKQERIRGIAWSIRGKYRRYKQAFREALKAAKLYLKPPSADSVFEPLTPVLLEPDGVGRYERELLHALKHDQIRNIAITGEYGAGKSSLIRTFVHRHPEFSYAFVSLATFGKEAKEAEVAASEKIEADSSTKPETQNGAGATAPAGGESEKLDSKTELDLVARIEETIVQQLLYSVPARDVPKSRLKRIIQVSNRSLLIRWGIGLALILAAIREYLSAAEKPIKVDPSTLTQLFIDLPFSGSIAVAVLVLGGAYLLYHALKLASLFSIDGLTLKGGKLEATQHGSVLHKNLDEIIYCFERSEINVVVIEDLDRFGLHGVFTRLREINFIIEHSPQIRRPVYFIYALRDEMFAVGEKTKFFDLIIPVIPVINSENSREKMAELLHKRGLKVGLAEKLIETVCYVIDDMRLVKNIVNEYDMFSTILVGNLAELNPNKLFAIVAIRNLYPDAYAELVKRRGLIYGVLESFDAWRRDQVSEAQESLKKLRALRAGKVNEVATSLIELRSYVWFALMNALGREMATHVLTTQGSGFTLKQFVTDSTFDGLVSTGASLQMGISDSYGRVPGFQHPGKPLDAILNEVSYEKRRSLLQNSFSEIDADIQRKQQEINQLSRMTFRGAAKSGFSDVIRDRLEGLGIVAYLMRSGYLDTDYSDYFGYFYEGSLSVDDKKFVVALSNGFTPEVSARVADPAKVIQKLDIDSLDDGKGIVAELIGHLCQTSHSTLAKDEGSDKLAFIFREGVTHHLERLAQAVHILLSRPGSLQFIEAIYNLQPEVFRELLDNAQTFQAIEARQSLVCAILDCLSEAQLGKLASHEYADIYEAIAELEDVSRLMPGLTSGEGGWHWLRLRPVRFKCIGDTMSHENVESLIKLGFFEVNLHMLSMIDRGTGQGPFAAMVAGAAAPRNITYRNLSTIAIDGLNKALLESPSDFVRVLLEQPGLLDESAASLITLFAAIEGHTPLMLELLERTHCSFEQLGDVPEVLWAVALRTDRINDKAEAVWTAFESGLMKSEDETTQLLVDGFAQFLKTNAARLNVALWQVEGKLNNDLQRFLLDLVDIDDSLAETLLKKTIINDHTILSPTLPLSRWKMLVRSSILGFSPEIYLAVKAHADALEAVFLQTQWSTARLQVAFADIPVSVLVQLSKSGAPSLQDRIDMWSSAPLDNVKSTEGAVEELGQVCRAANQAAILFPKSAGPLLQSIASVALLDAELRAGAITQILLLDDQSVIDGPLALLGDDGFGAISAGATDLEVPASDVNWRLISALETRGVIHSAKQHEGKIHAVVKAAKGGSDAG